MTFDRNQKRASAQTSLRPKPTIRSRLLLAVNLPLAALVAVFLAFDYSQELAERLEDKRIALEEEAKTVLPAVLLVRHHGDTGVQQYIDTVCGRMRDADSPGHHIAVELDGETYQAVAHHRASPEIMQAMQAAARSSSHRVTFGQTELLVGTHQRGSTTVYVSESLENLRASLVVDVLRRLLGFALLAIVAALVVNVVLVRIVSNPLNRLVGAVHQIGAGQLGTEVETFSTAELDYLAGEINAMSSSLAATDRDRKTQMAKARDIQRNLLPQDIDAPGIHVAQIFEPADDVGGDYYDILSLDDGIWLLCVADVVGHGVPAAMTAAMLKTLLSQAAERFTSPAEMLQFINQQFTAVCLLGDFVTMALVRADPRTGGLTYASAGHGPAWLLTQTGETRELSSTGMILGINSAATWDDMAINVAVGDRLLIITDGVSETLNQEGKMFGRERLTCVLAETRDLPVRQAAAKINEAAKDFRNETAQTDDVTILLVELSGDQSQWKNEQQ